MSVFELFPSDCFTVYIATENDIKRMITSIMSSGDYKSWINNKHDGLLDSRVIYIKRIKCHLMIDEGRSEQYSDFKMSS